MASDGQNEDIQLSFGFDTDKVAQGGDMIIRKMSEVQEATKKVEAQAVATNKAIATSNEERDRHETEMLSAARARQEAYYAQKLEQQRQADLAAARQARIASGETAQAYMEGLKRQFLEQELTIKTQLSKGLLDEKGSRLAARQNAQFYRSELMAGMQEPMFQNAAGKGGAAAMEQATKTVTGLERTIAATEKVGVAARIGSMGLGRLRYSMISLMDSMVGLPPIAGRVGGALASLALPILPLVATVAVIAGLGFAYKELQAPQKAVTEAQDKYAEVAQRSTLYTRQLSAELGRMSQLDTNATSKQIREIHKEADELSDMLTSKARNIAAGLQMLLRDAVTQDGSMSYYRKLYDMNAQLKSGKLTLAQYRQEIMDMGKANPFIQDLAKKTLDQVAATEELKKKQAELTAEANLAASTADNWLHKYSDGPVMGKALENLDRLKTKLVAAGVGGHRAADQVAQQFEGLDKARELWAGLVQAEADPDYKGHKVTFGGRLTLDDALKAGNDTSAGARARTVLQVASAEANLNKQIADTNRAMEERYRLNEKEKDRTTERRAEIQDQEKLAAAARLGAEAYAKVNEELRIGKEIRSARKSLEDESTDKDTHHLIISAKELARRQSEAEADIRRRSTAADTNKDRLSVTELRQEIDKLNESTAAHVAGREAVAQENVELRYQADLRKANAMKMGEERTEFMRLAGERHDAAMRENVAGLQAAHYSNELKQSQERTKQNQLQNYEAVHKEMSTIFDQFLSRTIGRGRQAWQTLWDDMKNTFEKALSGILADFAARKIASALAGVFSLAVPGAKGFMSSGVSGNISMGSLMSQPYASDPFAIPPGQTNGQIWGGRAMAGAGGALAGYGVGNMLYSTSHSNFGNMARGALGGAAAGALAGASIGGPVGAAIGAVAGFVGGILGAGSAAKEAEKNMNELRKSLVNSIMSIQAIVTNNSLDYSIAQVKQQFVDLRKQTEDAYAGGKNEAARNVVLAQLNQLEAQRIAQLQQEDALQRKNFAQDLQVRLLEAQGKQLEANALRLKLDQEREYNEAVKNNTDAITLALLKQVQAQEAIRAATLETTSALLNVPTGFKVARATFEAMPFGSPNRPGGSGVDFHPVDAGPVPNLPDINVNLMVDGKTIAVTTVRALRRMGAQQGLAPDEWSQVQVS
jgi:hypothetical protein